MVVERQLNAEGLSRTGIGREAFVRRVWEWKEQSGDTIGRQMRRLGASVDWSNEVRQRLAETRPATVGQAARIPGITPAAVSLLLVHLKRREAAAFVDRTAVGGG